MRLAAADLVRGLDAFVGLCWRHADVDVCRVGFVLVGRCEQFLGGAKIALTHAAPAVGW